MIYIYIKERIDSKENIWNDRIKNFKPQTFMKAKFKSWYICDFAPKSKLKTDFPNSLR